MANLSEIEKVKKDIEVKKIAAMLPVFDNYFICAFRKMLNSIIQTGIKFPITINHCYYNKAGVSVFNSDKGFTWTIEFDE